MKPLHPISVSLVQATPVPGDIPGNIERIRRVAQVESSDLVVFPELFLTGYNLKDDLPRLAVRRDGPEITELEQIAAGTGKHLILGAPYLDHRDRLYNAAFLIGPEGFIGHSFKWYLPNFLPFDEKRYFHGGRDTQVFETPMGTIGLQVCYDLFFPELCTLLAMKGADIVVNISASPSISRPYFETIIPARATENTVFFLYCNLTGTDERLTFWGGASAHSPTGSLLAKGEYFTDQVVRCELDLRELEVARSNRPVLRDKRARVFRQLHDLADG